MIFLRTVDEEGTMEPYCPQCEFSHLNPGAWAKITEDAAAHGINEGLMRNKCTRCQTQLVPGTKKSFIVESDTKHQLFVCQGCHESWPQLRIVKVLINESKPRQCDICERSVWP